MDNATLKEYRRLKRAGFDVSKHPTFQFNAGSETIKHAFGKLVTAYVGLDEGWHADCEVAGPQGEIDVLWYAPDRLTLAIEIETDPTDDVIAEKRARYVKGNDVIDDLHPLTANELPANVYDMRDHVRSQLNLF